MKEITKIAPAEGKLGILIPGMGAVTTTFIAGVEAVRRGLAKPIGSVTPIIAFAVPVKAMTFYLKHLERSPMDWLILGLGAVLFVSQLGFGWRALQWRVDKFDERPDKWLSNLAQAAEWFPLLGLLGTVGGILQTFSEMKGSLTPSQIIQNYAPAITATGSGLFMALLNILPTWLVNVGRDLDKGA